MPSFQQVILCLQLVDFVVQSLNALGGVCLESCNLFLLTKDYDVKVGLVATLGLESHKVATMLRLAFMNGV